MKLCVTDKKWKKALYANVFFLNFAKKHGCVLTAYEEAFQSLGTLWSMGSSFLCKTRPSAPWVMGSDWNWFLGKHCARATKRGGGGGHDSIFNLAKGMMI